MLENLGFRLVRARGRDESLFFVQVSAEQALLEQVRTLDSIRFLEILELIRSLFDFFGMIRHICEQYAEHLRMPIPLAMDKAAKRRAMAGDNVVSGFVRQQRSFKMVCLVTCRRSFSG